MPRFIAASDLSDRGDRAVHRSILLARDAKAKLTVISVVDDALPLPIARQMIATAEEELKRIVASFAESAGADVDVQVILGDPAPAVSQFAMTEEADLLVLGRHRSRPIADIFRQTTAERIVALVGCPVLLVSEAPARPYGSVIEAIDFSPASAAAAARAINFAPDAKHDGIHVYHVPYKGLMPGDSVSAFLHEAELAELSWRKRFGITVDTLTIRLVQGGVLSELAQAVATGKPDLIAVGAHGRTGLSGAILGSVASALMREPPCDLLIVRPDPEHFS